MFVCVMNICMELQLPSPPHHITLSSGLFHRSVCIHNSFFTFIFVLCVVAVCASTYSERRLFLIVWYQIHIENPTRCNSVSKIYFVFMWSSTLFWRHTAHHQEPKTEIAASSFSYVEGCWTCSCWTPPTWQRPATTDPTTFHIMQN
jgi:hypothetical protein